jgi:membrane-bound ClpP family serine protease
MKNLYLKTACTVLATLQITMIFALFTKTPPHPPLELAPFAMTPFLAASIAICIAGILLSQQELTLPSKAVILLAALLGLLSYGPQKYFDPVFPLVWPAVMTAQLAIVAMIVLTLKTSKPRKNHE